MNPAHRPHHYRLVIVATAILLCAAFFRFERFTSLPPGTHPDIGRYMSDGLRVSRVGYYPLYVTTYPEPLWRTMLAVAATWLQGAPFIERIMGGFVSVLTVAAAFKAAYAVAGLNRAMTANSRLVSAAVTAVAMTALVALQFINRQGYRAGLLPLAVAVTVILFARAWRRNTVASAALAGFSAGFAINTYTAGLVIPVAAFGVVAYMQFFAPKVARLSTRAVIALVLAMLLGMAPQVILALQIPNLYQRLAGAQKSPLGEASAGTLGPLVTSIPDLFQRFGLSLRAIALGGYPYPNYNAQDAPFLNPLMLLFALTGVWFGIRHHRRQHFALVLPLCLGILLLSLLPAVFTSRPDHPLRLDGSFVPLAIFAGLGAGSINGYVQKKTFPAMLYPLWRVLLGAVLLFSLGYAFFSFDHHWKRQDYWEDPSYWRTIPNYFSMDLVQWLGLLQTVDHPVYVPLDRIDSQLGALYLWSQAYPDVITSQHDTWEIIETLPPGEIWIPETAEFNDVIADPPQQFALLMPGKNGRGGTMSLLPPPPYGTADMLWQTVKTNGTPVLGDDTYDRTLGWRMAVDSQTIPQITAAPAPEHWHAVGVHYGDVLELVGYEAPLTLPPGETVRFTLYWRVLQKIDFDIFSFGSLMDSAYHVQASEPDRWLYQWIYPSPFWQVGEIIPDVRVFQLDETMPPGAYSFVVGLYTPPGLDHDLPILVNSEPVEDNFLPLTHHRVPFEPITLPDTMQPAGAQLADEIQLDGFVITPTLDSVNPGEEVTVTTFWHALKQPTADYTLFLHVENEAGEVVAQSDLRPKAGQYPTTVWAVDEVVPVAFSITLPADTEAPYRWLVGAYTFPSLTRLPVTNQREAADNDRIELK